MLAEPETVGEGGAKIYRNWATNAYSYRQLTALPSPNLDRSTRRPLEDTMIFETRRELDPPQVTYLYIFDDTAADTATICGWEGGRWFLA